MLISSWETLIIAILVLFVGRFLNTRVAFFRHFNIPEPVTGGFLASLLFTAIFILTGLSIEFELTMRDNLMLVFFSTIGLSSRFSTLKEGGISLVILMVVASLFLFVQNGIGVTIANLTGVDPLIGVVGGSISLSGGHGTAIAWAPILAEQFNLPNATEIGAACATFGLILGGLAGGPLAQKLIEKYNLTPSGNEHITIGSRYGEEHELIDAEMMLETVLLFAIAIGAGLHVTVLLQKIGLFLPQYVTCLFTGILLTNVLPYFFKNMKCPSDSASLALVSDLSLGLFLSMSLMSMQLWTLVDLALPILLILISQVVVLALFTYWVIFRVLGKDYDAAVMSAGYMGMALGATPNAIANMTAVTKHFGPSGKAFIVVPLIGAFFIDITNAIVIQLFTGWYGG
ncbi:sodium/glutamate symporter [Endozoicomonas arenosclerae]|uniref:sodium/glutamate symporter n=1 Tax=Endozoicomonas arenosclerae TaxID=1633495 RepID=UPI0007856C0A|nr:sodium/glutamate symporter [Endozoicomonas arenosclerae]